MADPICRWRNPYIKTIVELVNILPHEVMSSDEYRTIIEERWPGFLRTAYQLACQVGLYYESDDGIYYPRFDHDIDEEEAYTYMQRWIRKYYVPNPYTKSMKTLQHPIPFLASIIGYVLEHPEDKDLHSILENVFQENIGNIDIIANILNTYTDLMNVDNNGNVELTVKAQGFMKEYNDRNDKKAFFDNFSEEALEIAQAVVLREKAAATFLKKAIGIVIQSDPNMSRLTDLYDDKSGVFLKINNFNLWRKKDLPSRPGNLFEEIEISYNENVYVLNLELTPANMENLFFPYFNRAYEGMFKMGKEEDEYVLYKISSSKGNRKVEGPLQQIFYGAPGTGKSFKIKKDVEDAGRTYFRTTFHPDSDYSTFVGCYKPTMDKSAGNSSYEGITRDGDFNESKTKGNIIYSFTPQAFTNAYIKAWQTKEPVFLIIEEINRGNCAQIFGDLFQLLDRDENGYSQYKVDADTDLADHIRAELKKKCREDAPEYIYSEEELKLQLPFNFYIWATMNTSDQSLFPIDSAFKRRWEWVYSPIAEGKEKDGSKAEWEIEGQGKNSWWKFIQGINEVIDVTAHSEDKKLGFYFCKPTKKVNESDKYPTIITQKTFVNKVVFYLWNDVFKVYGFKSEIFDLKAENGTSKKITFKSFYKEDGSVNSDIVRVFVNNVMAKAPKSKDTENEEQNEIESETEA